MKQSINDKLLELYYSKWNKLSKSLNEIISDSNLKIKPTNPLLLKHYDIENFESSDIRVMIIGQETNDWEGPFYNDLKKICSVYSNFYKGNRFAHKGYFRNHFNMIVNLLENKFPDKKIGFFWNNVIKIGKANDKNIPPKYILDIIDNQFSVLNEEIKIIKPNIILFLSGPYYDKYIFHQIPDIEKIDCDDYTSNVLVSFNIKNVDFCFRTYHPNKTHFLGKKVYDKIYNTIVEKIEY